MTKQVRVGGSVQAASLIRKVAPHYRPIAMSTHLEETVRFTDLIGKDGTVIQQFNTTSSLGRLTLNILLSFAQFEREIIGERARDKICAARRRGKWTGGFPVLGYDVDPRGGRLLVNEMEATRVA
jgi:site-specific DNA recombinase